MTPSFTALFDTIRPCVALFADAWKVSLPMAHALCQNSTKIMAEKLSQSPYRTYAFHPNAIKLLSTPLNLSTLPQLAKYALPLEFFTQSELDAWHACHPKHHPKHTLCLVAVLMLSVYHKGTTPLNIGTAPINITPTAPDRKTSLSYEQKVWLGVFVFLGVLGLWIFQTISQTPPPPSNPKPKTEQHQKIPDVAIIRIDENKD